MISNSRTKQIIWGLAYWVVLVLSFLWALQGYWGNGLYKMSFDLARFIAATLAVVFVVSMVPPKNDIAALFITILQYLVIFPFLVVYVGKSGDSLYTFSVVIVFIIAEYIVGKIKPKQFSVENKQTVNISNAVVVVSVAIIVLTIIVLFLERGIPSLDALDISLTYDIRASYNLSDAAYRLYTFSANAIVPFLLAITLYKKNYLLSFLLFVVQFTLFLWLANKTTLFSIGVFFLGYYIASRKNSSLLFSRIMTIGIGIVSVLQGINKTNEAGVNNLIYTVYSLVVRRVLFVPAYLKHCYYEYFVTESHPLAGFFGTVLAPILTRLGVNNPYTKTAYTKIVGTHYYGVGSNANTGIFGRELAHFGFFGIVVAALCLIAFLLCVKAGERSNGKVFTCCVSIYTVFSMQDSGAIGMIDFSPMLLVAIILVFFNFKEYGKDKLKNIDSQKGQNRKICFKL